MSRVFSLPETVDEVIARSRVDARAVRKRLADTQAKLTAITAREVGR